MNEYNPKRQSRRSNVICAAHSISTGAVLLAGLVLTLPWCAKAADPALSQRPWMNKADSPEQRAALLVKAMTLDEEISMMHGVKPMPVEGYAGYAPAIPRLGIPALAEADGRAGVGNQATQVTLLPAPIAAASGWDPALLNTFGQVLGDEEWKKGTTVALSPSIDVVRVPEWGRTFESYGEDPYLNGQMAQAEIKGIQSQGPIANANMDLTMHQESNRFKEDSIVDERTLHEIYLVPFAAAVEQGHVGTVMCAYVKTNGVYSCESADVLNDMLRGELHFDGFVMSDWTATHSTVDAVENGLNQEMPGDKYFGASLRTAVESGEVSRSLIDQRVRQILVPMFRQGLFDNPNTGSWAANVQTPEHAAFSRHVAEQGTVLLKNDGDLLPLNKGVSIAVIGEAGGSKPMAEGAGSSGVKPTYVISPFDGLRKVAPGSSITCSSGSDLAAASRAATEARVAVVFVLTDETEGSDRPDLKLPSNQDQLIAAVAAANPRTIVVLDTGGPVLMPWIDKVAGVIEAWYPGQEDGNAIASILYGDVNPAAKLPLTFPRTASAIPTSSEQQWPGVDGRSVYSEKLNVGYRWYDTTNTEPLFPFGFGLSYTTFRLDTLSVTPKTLHSGSSWKDVTVKVSVTNTGKRAGAEVVQVYVQQPAANGEPPHQLHAFGKVNLAPGETKPLTLSLDERSFSLYDVASRNWKTPVGKYTVLVGTSSRDLPLESTITIAR
jgi:beta-glucosidase